MEFFDRDAKSGFNRIFDLNHDGKVGFGEQMMQFAFMDEMMHESEQTNDGFTYSNEAFWGGIDIMDEIEGMDEDEAREYLEEEGYDSDDFDL